MVLVIFSLFVFGSQAIAQSGGVYFVEWTPTGYTHSFILPAREGESPKRAVARYRSSVLMNPALHYLHDEVRQIPKDGEVVRLAPSNKPLAGIVANESLDLTQNSARIRDVIRPLEARRIRTLVLPPNADAGLNSLEALRYRRAAADLFDLLHPLGGDDIDPYFYDRAITYSVKTNRARDRSEYLLVKEFYRKGRGILFGICRGSQMIGIAAGCTLAQDIEKELGSSNHMLRKVAPIYPLDKEAYARFLGTEGAESVHLSHHQAVLLNPASLLRAIAHDGNGVIEMTESRDRRVIGVQFHPERDFAEPSEKLYDEIAARVRQTKKISCPKYYRYLRSG